MATREVDLIGQAITATEKEIAGAAWGNEEPVLDESGDRTIETMGEGLEGQHEPDDDDEAEGDESEGESEDGEGEADEGAEGETEPEPEGDGKGKPAVRAEGEREGRVPSGRLREANERAKVLETQLATRDGEFKTLADKLDLAMRQIDDLRRTPRAEPANPAEPAGEQKVPDFFEDPAGFLAAQTKPLVDRIGQLSNQIVEQRVNTSMTMARRAHADVFDKAFEALTKLNPQNPDDRSIVQRVYGSSDPGEAVVAWHKRNETLREVGDDPATYAEKVRTAERDRLMKDPEFRKALLADLRAEANQGSDGKPNTVTRLPRSLNGAAGGNRRDAAPVQYDDNDQAIADNAWR